MRAFIAVIIAGSGLGALLCLLIAAHSGGEEALLMAAALCCPVALGVPLLLRRLTVYDPAFIVFAYVLIGCVGTGAYLAYGEGPRRDFLMNGEGVAFFAAGGAWLAASLFLFGLGNALFSARIPIEKIRALQASTVVSKNVLLGLAVVALAVSAAATITFLDQTGGLSLDALSRKRSLLIDADGGAVVRGNASYLRNLATITAPVLLILIGSLLARRERLSLSVWGLLLVLTLSALAVPFFGSSRAGVAILLIQIGMMISLFYRLRLVQLVTAAAILCVVFGAMTSMRTQAQQGIDQPAANALGALAASGNGLSISGNSLIIQRVPERLDYLYGSSLFTWVTAPIPRSLWPNKPEVGLGKLVKGEILTGQSVVASGRPPSLMAEGWMNFGPVGFLVFAFCGGWICRVLWETFAPYLGTSVAASALYLLLLQEVTSLVNAGVSQVLVRVLTTIAVFSLVMLPLLWRGRHPRAARRGGAQGLSAAPRP